MQRFKFTLETLHRFLKRQRQQLENQLVALGRDLSNQQKQLDRLHSELQQSSYSKTGTADPASLQNRLAASDYQQRIRQLAALKQQQVQTLQKQRDGVRKQFLSLSKEVESLKTLRANQLAEHRSKNARLRQAELNDQITNLHFRTKTKEIP